MTPVTAEERFELLDVLRGIAVLGILTVNQEMFFAPLYLPVSGAEWWTSTADRIAAHAVDLFAQGKFYALFSILFGAGMAVQLERAERRGVTRFGAFFARRMACLLLIGLAHALLLWFGDILTLYALLGFALILFRKRSDTALLVWSAVLILLPVAFFAAITALTTIAGLIPEGAAQIDATLAENQRLTLESLERARVIYAEGNWTEILRERLGQLGLLWSYTLMFAPNILGLFVLGFALGRRHVLQEPAAFAPRLRRWIWPLAAVGIAGNLASVMLQAVVTPGAPSPLALLQQAIQTPSAPALTLAYMAAVALAMGQAAWARGLRHLAPVGRMALTNYLTHSVVFTLLANSYGLGLYGRVGPAVGLGLALLVFAAQVPLSALWLGRFRFGPAEWLWRSMTYGRLQPMRR
jgi:uncharacterized protein